MLAELFEQYKKINPIIPNEIEDLRDDINDMMDSKIEL